jgi:hypothetical protein
VLKVLPGHLGPIHRFGTLVAGATAGVLVLAGCAAGQDAQTIGQRPPIDGASASAGSIDVRAAGIISPDSGSSYKKGASAPLQLVLINTGPNDDTLTSISSPVATAGLVNDAGGRQGGDSASPSATSSASDSSSASGSASVSSTASSSASSSSSATSSSATRSAPIKLPAGQSVQVGFGGSGPSASLTGLTAALYPAQPVQVTFTFGSGATVTVTMSVKLASQAPSAPTISEATKPAE